MELSERNQAVQQVMKYFSFDHLPPELKEISSHCYTLAQQMLISLPDSPELTVGLRKLIEAKDCFVRAKL